jgi:hypothetical protein
VGGLEGPGFNFFEVGLFISETVMGIIVSFGSFGVELIFDVDDIGADFGRSSGVSFGSDLKVGLKR